MPNRNHSIERYRQYARPMNTRHDKKFFVELNFYDQLNNLRSECNSLKMGQTKPSQADVSRAYFGSKSVNKTMTLMASFAIKLSEEATSAIGEITNIEDPNLCITSPHINTGTIKSSSEVEAKIDCRVFKDLVNLNSL